MSRLPADLRFYTDLRQALDAAGITAAERDAGKGYRVPDIAVPLQAFLGVWNLDAERKAELSRRANLVRDRTGPGTPYAEAKARGKRALKTLRAPEALVRAIVPGSWTQHHHLSASLAQERAILTRVLAVSPSQPPTLERWSKELLAIEAEAQLLRADGCWYMTHPEQLEALLTSGLGSSSGVVVLTSAAHAAEALIEWAQEILPAAKTKEGEGTGGAGAKSPLAVATGQETPPADPRALRKAALSGLEPAVRKAYLAFEYAETMKGCAMQDRVAYEWVREHGIDQGKGDCGELADYRVPESFETFKRYVVEAQQLSTKVRTRGARGDKPAEASPGKTKSSRSLLGRREQKGFFGESLFDFSVLVTSWRPLPCAVRPVSAARLPFAPLCGS